MPKTLATATVDRRPHHSHTVLTKVGALPARLGTHRPFTDLISDMEAALDLQRHRPGTLPRHTTYLHQRTAGRIGSLARLIREAALTAILDGTERITRASPDTVRLDHLAEAHHKAHTHSPAFRVIQRAGGSNLGSDLRGHGCGHLEGVSLGGGVSAGQRGAGWRSSTCLGWGCGAWRAGLAEAWSGR